MVLTRWIWTPANYGHSSLPVQPATLPGFHSNNSHVGELLDELFQLNCLSYGIMHSASAGRSRSFLHAEVEMRMS